MKTARKVKGQDEMCHFYELSGKIYYHLKLHRNLTSSS